MYHSTLHVVYQNQILIVFTPLELYWLKKAIFNTNRQLDRDTATTKVLEIPITALLYQRLYTISSRSYKLCIN